MLNRQGTGHTSIRHSRQEHKCGIHAHLCSSTTGRVSQAARLQQVTVQSGSLIFW